MEHVLPALREIFGAAYTITWDFTTRTFRATRKDNGAVLERAAMAQLWDAVRDDCAAAPVILPGRGVASVPFPSPASPLEP